MAKLVRFYSIGRRTGMLDGKEKVIAACTLEELVASLEWECFEYCHFL